MTAAPSRRWTADEVTAALWRHLTAGGWSVLEEVACPPTREVEVITTPSGERYERERDRRRVADVIAVRKPRRRKDDLGDLERLVVEVKVTRADFTADVRNAAKQAAWRAHSHRHAFAAPEGLIVPAEVPAESGLLVVDLAGTVKWARQAPYVDAEPGMPGWLGRAFAYRAAAAEGKLKGRFGSQGDPHVVRAQLERAQKDARAASLRADRALEEKDLWRALAARQGHKVPCAHCGSAVVPRRLARGEFADWRHADPTVDASCEDGRRTAAEQAAVERFGAVRDWTYVPPVMPAEGPPQ